jgi:Ca-activated chloride channel family protein
MILLNDSWNPEETIPSKEPEPQENDMKYIASLGIFASLCLLGTPKTQGRFVDRHIPPIHPSVIRVERTKVLVRILDGIAETTIRMTLKNPGNTIGEKILVLPLPKGAVADGLELEIGGKMQKGEILPALQARRIYTNIVRRRRDPALLEYMGRDTLKLRAFPIPPHGKTDVKVRFRMLLPQTAGIYGFEFPTRAVEAGMFSMEVRIKLGKANHHLANVYSPLAGLDIRQKDDKNALASFECKGRPQQDPAIYYSLTDREFGVNLMTYRRSKGDGYFLLLASPKRDWKTERTLTKTVSFVLDTSGSMQGKKILQARKALRFFLQSLSPKDHFNLIPFSTESRPFAKHPVPATPEQIAKALKFGEEIEAQGGTNIEEALRFALSAKIDPNSVPIVVFLTDGLPTIGKVDTKEILNSTHKANLSKARIFVFGVGYDVNTYLLDQIAGNTRGARDYVKPEENIEVKTSALFEKIAHPVLTDLSLGFDQIQTSRIVPRQLPDLFKGSRLVVVGRYKGGGSTAIRLKGKVGTQEKTFVFEGKFLRKEGGPDFVATLWAQKRIGLLLDQLRLHGPNKELKNEVTKLGRDFGIVTPYTSSLVVEERERLTKGADDFGFDRRNKAADASRARRDLGRAGVVIPEEESMEKDAADAPSSPAPSIKRKTGKKAVLNSLKAAKMQFFSRIDQEGKRRLWKTQRRGGHLFHLISGIWIDANLSKAHKGKVRRIEAFSKDYFDLLTQHPKLAKVLAFSTAMVIVLGPEEAVEIIPSKG